MDPKLSSEKTYCYSHLGAASSAQVWQEGPQIELPLVSCQAALGELEILGEQKNTGRAHPKLRRVSREADTQAMEFEAAYPYFFDIN